MTDSPPRPATNENFLLINAFAPQTHSPLVAITKRITDCGCNLTETRVATLGRDVSVYIPGRLRTGSSPDST